MKNSSLKVSNKGYIIYIRVPGDHIAGGIKALFTCFSTCLRFSKGKTKKQDNTHTYRF